MTDPLTQYKLIVLYILDKLNFSLTRSQIFEIIIKKEYTNYFTLQQVIYELNDSGLIAVKTIRNSSHLTITEEGRETLSFFSNRISDSIKEDINNYLKDSKLELRNEVSVQATYYKTTSMDYAARLLVKEKKVDLIDLTLTVPSEEAASHICDSWRTKNQEIYAYLMKQLL